jgi:hypothetical protein
MNTEIHRLLDEAFAGVEPSPESQDLKEEIRANLLARVAELEASGASPGDAAHRAIEELGDLHELLASTEPAPSRTPETDDRRNAPYDLAAVARNRVRPEPAFVLRTVLLSVVAATALVVFALGVATVVPVGVAALLGLGALVAVPLGVVTADALLQETTSNYPLPWPRAAGFGAAVFGAVAALLLAGLFVVHPDAMALAVAAALLLVAAVALFAWLGATKTNRHKAWTRSMAEHLPPNRFEQDPDAAARFGIYSIVIWVVTFGVILLLGFTVGWWWSLLAILGGLAATMLVLARMLFGPRPPAH